MMLKSWNVLFPFSFLEKSTYCRDFYANKCPSSTTFASSYKAYKFPLHSTYEVENLIF